MESGSLGATCTTVMSYGALRAGGRTPLSVDGKRLRSIPITGVMPEPAVTNSRRTFSPRLRGRQDELAGCLLEVDQRARAGVAARCGC